MQYAAHVGNLTDAAYFAPIDASALGVTRPGSVAIAVAGDLVGSFGTGVAHGALQAYGGASAYSWRLGAGYARTLRARELWHGVYTSVGGQLVTGYRHVSTSGDDGALSLTIPGALSLGNPDSYSVTVYAAPFGEVGVTRPWSRRCLSYTSCRTIRGNAQGAGAIGLGSGLRVAAQRVAVDFLMPDRSFATLGLSWRFGR